MPALPTDIRSLPRLARSPEALRARYDAVVVGSGYGGGVAALRLAQAGKRVAILERGREFLTGEFPARFPDVRSQLRLTGRLMRSGPETALYDVRLGEDMHVIVGCGLGGGSLINAGVALRPDARVFADLVWPEPVRADGLLDEGYRRAARWLRPARDPRAQELRKHRALSAAGRALGTVPVCPPVAVSFEPAVNPAGIAQPACTRCGDCCAGCNVGAKNTVALTYLPAAARHGAEIFTHAKVRQVTKTREGAWRVHLSRLDGTDDRELALEAAVVVLAAGTLGSTEILLRSRERGLELSDRLGQRFSANGDIIAFGYGSRIPVNAIGVGHPPRAELEPVGACVSGQIEIHDGGDCAAGVCIQEGVMPSALAPVLPVMFVPNGRLIGAVHSLIKGVYKGPFAGLQTFFAVSHDSAAGELRLESDEVRLSWPGAKDQPVYQRLNRLLGALVSEVGGSYVPHPLGAAVGRQPATAHPLGGAVMSEDRGGGVIDHKGRVFDRAAADSTAVHRGLYIMDGAVIPRSLGVNPLLTITALAERAMLHLGADYGFSGAD